MPCDSHDVGEERAPPGPPFLRAGKATRAFRQPRLGTWLAVVMGTVSFAYYISMAAETGKLWLRIGIRVAGSWIVAITLLILAFALRK